MMQNIIEFITRSACSIGNLQQATLLHVYLQLGNVLILRPDIFYNESKAIEVVRTHED